MNVKLDPGAFMPRVATRGDAGYDIFSPIDAVVPAMGRIVIPTGVHIELPEGTCAILKSKSGLMAKHGVVSEGLIDEPYRGQIHVIMFNHSTEDYEVRRGDKISQFIVVLVHTYELRQVDTLSETERGENGFGSTGR